MAPKARILKTWATSRLEEFRQLAWEAGFAVTLTKIGEEAPRRGRKSKWVEEELAHGAILDDLLINQGAREASSAGTDRA